MCFAAGMSAPKPTRLPLGVTITAGYLILLGLVRLGGFVFSARPSSMSSSMIALYVSKIALAAMLVVAGAALFQRKRWSRRFALGALGVVGWLLIEKEVMLVVYGVSIFFPYAAFGLLLSLTALLFVCLLRRSAIESLS